MISYSQRWGVVFALLLAPGWASVGCGSGEGEGIAGMGGTGGRTGTGGTGGAVVSGFEFDYQTDDALAVSGDVTPAAGGTIACTGADGVGYSLEVLPGAVAQNTSITMTPLKYLTITNNDPGTLARAADDGCNVGVWLEPAGLEFDSTAVLTVSFPDTVTCSVTDDLRGIFIDPERSFYTIQRTDVDTAASVLALTLSHFSIYGTEEITYESLGKLIALTIDLGLEFPTLQNSDELMLYSEEAELREWADLQQEASNGAHEVLAAYAEIITKQALATLSHEDILKLHGAMERALLLKAYDIKDTLDAGSTAVIERMILRGTEWCGAGRYEDGSAILKRALDYIGIGMWHGTHPGGETGKLETVANMADQCEDVQIVVVSNKDVIYDIALGEFDTETHTDISVWVDGASLGPIANQSVSLSIEHLGDERYYESLGSKTTDGDGRAVFRYGYKPKFGPPEGVYKLTASTHHVGKVFTAENLLELRRRRITLTYDYSYVYHRSTDNSSHDLTASFVSVGTRSPQSVAGCDFVTQNVTQSSSVDQGTYTHTASHVSLPKEISACFFQVMTVAHHTDDNPDLRTAYFVLDKLSVGMRAPIYTRMRRVVFDGVETDEDIIEQDAVIYFSMVYPPYPESNEVFLYYTGAEFTPFNFSDSTPDDFGHGVLAISAELETN